MDKNNFCPFINSECKPHCVFNCGHWIAINNGKSSKCELAAFVSARDDEDIDRIVKEISSLLQRS